MIYGTGRKFDHSDDYETLMGIILHHNLINTIYILFHLMVQRFIFLIILRSILSIYHYRNQTQIELTYGTTLLNLIQSKRKEGEISLISLKWLAM